jgi:DME family drug/metabolite transporter
LADPKREQDRKALAFGRRCVLAAAILWSLSGVVTKSLPLGPLAIAFYRSLFAGLAIGPFVPRARRVFRPAMLPLSLVFGAMIGLYIGAVKSTTAANAIYLQFTATFWMVPASALLLRERPDRRSLVGIALAMVGIVVIVLWGYKGSDEAHGIVLGLASGVAFAGVATGIRGMRGSDPIWLSAVLNLGGAIALGGWMLVTSGSIPVPTPGQAAVLIAFGVVQMAIPYALFARGLREVGAPEAGLLALIEPLLNPVWVVAVHHEVPSPATLAGGAFLLAGLACRYAPTRPAREVDWADDQSVKPATGAKP